MDSNAWARRGRMVARAIQTVPADVGYLGFAGEGNLGDDAICEPIRARLRPSTTALIPLGPTAMTLAVKARLNRPLPGLLLGGGTLVGRRNWLRRMDTARHLFRPRYMASIGVGVEDEAEGRFSVLTDRSELERWKATMRAMHRFSVRGPRSAELLADIGVDASVVGDPAFLLHRDAPLYEKQHRHNRVIVVLGEHEITWADDPVDRFVSVCQALLPLAAQGTQIVFLLFRKTDRDITHRVTTRSGLSAPVLDASRDLTSALRTMGSSRLVVADRLHAAVLAAVVATPTLMIEYRPKARDIASLLGPALRTVRIDRVDANIIREEIDALDDGWNSFHHRLIDRVTDIAGSLEAEIQRVWTDLHPDYDGPRAP